MNKISIFSLCSLLSLSAFGQVNWGEFNELLGANARGVVEASFQAQTSNCASRASRAALNVVAVDWARADIWGDALATEVRMVAPGIEVSVEIVNNDLNHNIDLSGEGGLMNWRLKSFQCWESVY